MNPVRGAIGGLLVLGLLLTAQRAQAEEGELQLGLATPFLVYSKATDKLDAGDSKTSGWAWGIGHNVVGEIGYGVTANLNLGGLFQLNGTSGTDESVNGDKTDFSSTSILLGPKLDYIILPGDKVQPFVGAVIGYQRSKASVEDFDSTTSGFTFMGRVGLRAFPGKEFSIDPWLGISYFTGSVKNETGGASDDHDISSFGTGVYLGISGWIH